MPIVGLLPGVGRLVINGETQGCMASGVTKGPADPAVRGGGGGAILGGRQIVV